MATYHRARGRSTHYPEKYIRKIHKTYYDARAAIDRVLALQDCELEQLVGEMPFALEYQVRALIRRLKGRKA
jgi:hypothetical protein